MLKKKLFDFSEDESGATAIEYGLIAALISVVVIVALTFVGGGLNQVFASIACSLENLPGIEITDLDNFCGE